MEKWNIWDVFTMIPIFACAFLVNNIYFSINFICIGITGIFFHCFTHNYRLLILDIIAITSLFVTYTVFCKIPEYIKPVLYAIEIMVIAFLCICMIFKIQYSSKILMTVVSLIWIPLLILTIKYVSNATGWIAVIALFLYMSSSCLCNPNQLYIRFSWPVFHITVAILGFFALYEMDFLHSEVYKPIEPILDWIITEVKENMIS